MAERPSGLYSKLSREGALALAIVWLAFQFADRAGLAKPPLVETRLDPQIKEGFDRGVTAVEANRRLLEDIHSGIAPRDMNLVPQWSALRQSLDKQTDSIDKLTRSIDKNTDSNYYRLEIEPPGTREAKTQERRSLLDRLWQWLSWDSAAG